MTPEQLRHAVAQIENTELQKRVLRRSLDYGKEHEPMKTKRHIGRIAAAAAAAVLALSVTAFAAVRQLRVDYSAPNTEVMNLEEAQEWMQAVGSELALPETFSNGYQFSGANHPLLADGTETAGLVCVYEKEEESLCLRVAPSEDETEASGDEIQEPSIYREPTVSVSRGSAELEPETEAKVTDLLFRYREKPLVIECADEDASEGSGAAERITIVDRTISWEQDGVAYELAQMEGSLTQEELLEMALELSGQK